MGMVLSINMAKKVGALACRIKLLQFQCISPLYYGTKAKSEALPAVDKTSTILAFVTISIAYEKRWHFKMTDTTGTPTQEVTDSLPEEPIVSADSSETYSKRIKRYTILTSDETVKLISSSIWSWPIVTALTITVALTVIAIYFKVMLLLAAAIALLGTIAAWLTFAAYGCGTGIRDYLKDCEIEFSELNDLRVNLFTYLNEIDDRTSRYFHCMPQDLLTVYYRLRQIEAQLTTILNEADYLCSLKSKYSALQALNILKSPFRYRDSMSINTGTEYEIALYAVPKTIQELVTLLESKLTKLEDDLAVTVFEETPEEVSSESEEDEPKV